MAQEMSHELPAKVPAGQVSTTVPNKDSKVVSERVPGSVMKMTTVVPKTPEELAAEKEAQEKAAQVVKSYPTMREEGDPPKVKTSAKITIPVLKEDPIPTPKVKKLPPTVEAFHRLSDAIEVLAMEIGLQNRLKLRDEMNRYHHDKTAKAEALGSLASVYSEEDLLDAFGIRG